MRNILIAVGAIILLVILFIAWQTFLRPLFPFFTQKGKVVVGGHTYTVEVMKTQADQEKGLSGRHSLGENNGMLFVFNNPDYHPFWMKKMQFPIDIIYISGNKIVTIHKNAPPPSSETETLPLYTPTAPSDKVLELNAGQADKYSIKEGDTAEISL